MYEHKGFPCVFQWNIQKEKQKSTENGMTNTPAAAVGFVCFSVSPNLRGKYAI